MDPKSGKQEEGDSPPANSKLQIENGSSKSVDDKNSEEEREQMCGDSGIPDEQSLEGRQTKSQEGSKDGTADIPSINDGGTDSSEHADNTTSKEERESLLDGLIPIKTDETENTSGKSQSSNGDLSKRDEDTTETAQTDERGRQSGGAKPTQTEKRNTPRTSHQSSGRNIFTEGEDTVTTPTTDERENGSSKSADDKNSEEEREQMCGDSGISDEQSLEGRQTKSQEGSKDGTADIPSINDGERLPDGVNSTKTEEKANTSGEVKSGGGGVLKKDGGTTADERTDSSEHADNTSSKENRESLLDGVIPIKTDEIENTSGERQSRNGDLSKKDEGTTETEPKDERESPLDGVNPMETDPTENISGESQSSNGDLSKKDEGTTETETKDERGSQSGCAKPTQTERRNTPGTSHQCSGRNIFTEGEEAVTTPTKDENKQDIELKQLHEEKHLQSCGHPDKNSDIHGAYETIKKKYDEVLWKFESISKENQDLVMKTKEAEHEKADKNQACEELVQKDIENQEMMYNLKSDLLDIKNGYNEMEKQKSSVDKKLKEVQKAWEKERNKLQKDHEDESKKHRQELEKANKTIGRLNKKVTEKDGDLKVKEQIIDNLKREKTEIDKRNADNEKYKQSLHERIKKMNNQKTIDESEHNKKVKELGRVINAEHDNFNRLSYQYNELMIQLQEEQREKRALKDEKQDLLLRLSKVAGANLTYNNPNIADLSDEKRPTKLAEEFSELYDNEWTDAFEDLPIESEKEKTTFMLKLLMRASQLCSDVSSSHSQKIKESVCTLVLQRKSSKCSKESIEKDNVPATIAEDTSSNISTENEQEQKENGEYKDGKHVEDTKLSQSEKGESTKLTDTEGSESSDDPGESQLAHETNENAQKKNDEIVNSTNHPPVAHENIENAQEKKEQTTDNANQPPVANVNNENAQEKTEETTDNANQPQLETDGEGTKLTKTEGSESSDDPGEPQLAHETNENAQKKNDEIVNSTNHPPVTDVYKDEENEKSDKQDDTDVLSPRENKNGQEFNPQATQVDLEGDENMEGQEKQNEKLGLSTSKDTNTKWDEFNAPKIETDLVGVDNKEQERQDETNMSLSAENTPDDESNAQRKKKKENDGVVVSTTDTVETEVNPVKEIGKDDIETKQVVVVICDENVDDISESKETDASAVKEIGTEEIEKEIKLEVDFDKLLQKEQKKTIIDAKKLVEKHLSEEIEAAGTDLIIQEHGIDPQTQESVVVFIKKCLNICWSMNRNEPPVFVDFPDISENIKFDTNIFKPYTKAGRYVDFIVWPAIYLHKEGPLLCKGVAQGRKE